MLGLLVMLAVAISTTDREYDYRARAVEVGICQFNLETKSIECDEKMKYVLNILK